MIPLTPDLIPEPFQDWIVDITERMQCPLEYVAVGAVIVTASLIGAGCGIRPKSKDTWTVIPNLWGGIVGAPSTLKSPALKEIIKPLEDLESKASEAFEQEQQANLIDLEAYKAAKEIIKKKMSKAAANSDPLAMDQAKEEMGKLDEPKKLIRKRYSTNDATIEKIHELLSENERGLLLFRDELMGLLSSWNKEGHECDRSFYLEAWNGNGSKTTDRIGRGTIHTKNLCVSLLGSTQPSKLIGYFQRVLAGTENDGLLQRFQMLIYPDEPKQWNLIDRNPNITAREHAYGLMTKLSNMEFCEYGASLDESTGIPYFHFNEQAQEIFYDWLRNLEYNLRNNHDDPVVTEHLAKYRKLLPALALIFHLINLAHGKSPGPITEECTERAIGWSNYLESHARRIYESTLNPCYHAARKLARKIQARELQEDFDTRMVYRRNWSLLRGKEEVQFACDILIEEGWLKMNNIPENGRTKSYYIINPKVIKSID